MRPFFGARGWINRESIPARSEACESVYGKPAVRSILTSRRRAGGEDASKCSAFNTRILPVSGSAAANAATRAFNSRATPLLCQPGELAKGGNGRVGRETATGVAFAAVLIPA